MFKFFLTRRVLEHFAMLELLEKWEALAHEYFKLSLQYDEVKEKSKKYI